MDGSAVSGVFWVAADSYGSISIVCVRRGRCSGNLVSDFCGVCPCVVQRNDPSSVCGRDLRLGRIELCFQRTDLGVGLLSPSVTPVIWHGSVHAGHLSSSICIVILLARLDRGRSASEGFVGSVRLCSTPEALSASGQKRDRAWFRLSAGSRRPLTSVACASCLTALPAISNRRHVQEETNMPVTNKAKAHWTNRYTAMSARIPTGHHIGRKDDRAASSRCNQQWPGGGVVELGA
jgi:hypothetical protein